jgi:hypothetical protein
VSDIREAVEHLKVLERWFKAKRDVLDNVPGSKTQEINGKRIIDLNHALWDDFLDELEPALAILLGHLEEKSVAWPLRAELLA